MINIIRLIRLADRLDKKGFVKEADEIDNMLQEIEKGSRKTLTEEVIEAINKEEKTDRTIVRYEIDKDSFEETYLIYASLNIVLYNLGLIGNEVKKDMIEKLAQSHRIIEDGSIKNSNVPWKIEKIQSSNPDIEIRLDIEGYLNLKNNHSGEGDRIPSFGRLFPDAEKNIDSDVLYDTMFDGPMFDEPEI